MKIFHKNFFVPVLFFLFFIFCFSLFINTARSASLNILPSAKHASDTTGDTLAGITSDNATENPDTLSAVSTLDNVYTVNKSAVFYITSFDTSSIPGGASITGAVLHLQYGAENGYNGTNFVRYNNGGGLTDTTIRPTDIAGWSADLTYNLYTAGVDTVAELGNLDLEFTNNDGSTSDAIHFDYMWVEVTYSVPSIITVATAGTQTVSMIASSTSNYAGGAFTFIRDSGSTNATQIKISEKGTVNANTNLSNLKLYYKQEATCSSSIPIDATVFNALGVGFNGSDVATVTGTMAVGTSQICVYAQFDIAAGASLGQTVELEITNPSTEVTVSADLVAPATAVTIAGATTISNPIIDLTASTQDLFFNASTPNTVFTSDQTGYTFYSDLDGSCVYKKSTDGGATWGNAVTVDSQTDCAHMAVWYDQWTPGDNSGTYIHVMTIDTGSSDVWYTRLNTTNDSKTTTLNATGANQGGNFVYDDNLPSITKGTDGNLYMGINSQNDSFVIKCVSGADCAQLANWTEAGTTPFTGIAGMSILMPLASGNILAIHWSIGTEVMMSKVYNKAGNSWDASWTTIDSPVIDYTLYMGSYGATVNKTTNDIYLAYAADFGTPGAEDIRTAIYSSGAWTSKTNVITNISGKVFTNTKIVIDQNTNDLYVIYSYLAIPTLTTANVYWKKSTDGMATWGAEQGPINFAQDDIFGVDINLMSNERIYATWLSATPNSVYGATIVDLVPSAALTVNTAGTQVSSLNIPSTDGYVGGAFTLISSISKTVTQIVLAETGSVNANTNLSNLKLYYKQEAACSSSIPVDATVFNVTGVGFNSSDVATVTGTIAVGTSQICVYAKLDVGVGASPEQVLDLQITNPSTDITVSAGTVTPATVIALSGSTLILDPGVWPFTLSTNYSYDPSKISVTGGAAKLVSSSFGSKIVGYWHFDEATWTGTQPIVIDSSSNNYNGTAYTPASTTATAKLGRAGSFSNIGTGRVEVAEGSCNNLEFGSTGSFTESVWMKINPALGSEGTLIGKKRGVLEGYKIAAWYTGLVRFEINEGGLAGTTYRVNSTAIYNDNAWHLIIAQRDVPNNKMEMWIDNVYIGSTTITALNLDTTANFAIGANATGGIAFAGLIDEAMIFNDVLTASERSAIWNSGNGQTFSTGAYPTDNPTIVNALGQNFSTTLNSFTETLGVGNQGLVKYQISNNAANWYYWNGSNWVIETGSGYPTQTNTAAEVSNNATQFDNDIGIGSFYFKAFLASNGAQQVELDQVDLTYDQNDILTVDIVDGSGISVASPSVNMTPANFSFACQTATGVFGTADQKIRLENQTATPTWTLSIVATAATSTWLASSLKYDFNDANGTPAGCSDGADADSVGGQMTINPSGAIITPQGSCTAVSLSLGAQSAFVEGTNNSVTLLSAGASANTACIWDLTNIAISQTIPAEQTPSTYMVNLTVTIVAN
jgi:hypothetical protein